MLTHFSLFSGIGGMIWQPSGQGLQRLDKLNGLIIPQRYWKSIGLMCRDGGIYELTYDKFVERTGLRTVDLISGGFPCQPFSVAGKQKR